MEQLQTNSLGTDPIGKLIKKFAIPGVISLLVNSLYNLVDQIFIGHGVGYLGNGATNIVYPISIIALAFALLVGDGAASYLSLKLGEGDKEEARKGTCNAILLLIILGLFFAIAGSLLLKPLLTLFGATEILMPYALEYGRVIVLGLPLVLIGAGLNPLIRADSSPAFAMGTMILGAVINTVLDPIFIFILHMGVKGAAIATVIGQAATLIMTVLYLFRFKSFQMKTDAFRIRLRTVKKIISLGISSFITQLAITIVMAVSNNILVLYGAQSIYGAEIPVTALGIVMKVSGILTSILVGVSTGAQPIIGFNYGAENFGRVRKTFSCTVIISLIICLAASMVFFIFPKELIRIFGTEGHLYTEFAIKSFRIFLMLCISFGLIMPTGVYLQATGQPIKATVVSLSRQLFFFIPAACILSRLLGVKGFLWAGPLADGLACFVSLAIILPEMINMKKRSTQEKN